MPRFAFVAVSLLSAAIPLPAALPVVADSLFVNGKVWTGDPARPNGSAVAVWRDRVLAVGSDADVRPLAGPSTRVIDLAGKRLVPGFSDSHVHLLNGGLQLSRVELKDAADEAEFGKRLREFDAKLPPGRWMLGGNWDHDRTFAGKLPTAALLDSFVQTRPVFLRRYDGHMAVANTAALKLAKVTADTPDPPGGVIVRGADGKTPAGVLKDNAMGLVPDPEADEGEIADAIRAALAAFAEAGVTSVQDMEGSGSAARRVLLKTLQRLDRRGELTCRVDIHWPIESHQELAKFGTEAGVRVAVRAGRRGEGVHGRVARFEYGEVLRPVHHRPDDQRGVRDRAGPDAGVGAVRRRGPGLRWRSTPSATGRTPTCSTYSRRCRRKTGDRSASNTSSTCGRSITDDSSNSG